MKKSDLINLLGKVTKEDEVLTNPHERVLLIDGLNLFFRNFAMMKMVNQDGAHVGGLGGFLRSLNYLVNQLQPTSVYVVFDGAGSPTLSGNKAVGGSLPSAGQYVGGKKASSANSLFAPAAGGEFIVKGTGTDASETAISATVSVDGDESASLALDAANAATDAANNAYDEAQNATQAASDALAAVTALAKQVKTLIANVKKLTKAVAKLK